MLDKLFGNMKPVTKISIIVCLTCLIGGVLYLIGTGSLTIDDIIRLKESSK